MANQAAHRLPWNDRWAQPNLNQLLAPLKSHHRRTLHYVMDALAKMEGVEQSILWYGPAWKWTIHYTLKRAGGSGVSGGNVGGNGGARNGKLVEAESLCYLVPRVEAPMVCVPLSDAVLRELPIARLGKVVRDGIKMAKCAVTIHWATWTPTSQAEALQIIDLLKRRHKMATEGDLAAKHG